jgi:hypothetical protein
VRSAAEQIVAPDVAGRDGLELFTVPWARPAGELCRSAAGLALKGGCHVIDYAAFSALRLRHLFPPDLLDSFPYYHEVQPDGRTFDIEFMGGLWDDERIDGVALWFPQAAPGKVGIVEVSAGPYGDALPEVGKTEGFTGRFVDPDWAAHADTVLAALGVPVRMGGPDTAVRRLAAGRIQCSDFPGGARRFLSFASRAPAVYHLQAVVHDHEGLLRLAVRRPTLVRANDAGGGYDLFTAGLHDEGPVRT